MGIGAGHKALKHLSKSITEIRQGNLRPAVGQVPKREPFEKDLVEDLGGHPDTRATALAGANRPGSFAATALPAPASKVQDFGLTTRGFRMLSVHTRELSRRSSKAQMEKPASSLNLSTEFLYPTPNCDLKLAASLGASRNMKSGGKRDNFRLTCSFKRFVGTPDQRPASPCALEVQKSSIPQF